jgi:hypothetical protein
VLAVHGLSHDAPLDDSLQISNSDLGIVYSRASGRSMRIERKPVDFNDIAVHFLTDFMSLDAL